MRLRVRVLLLAGIAALVCLTGCGGPPATIRPPLQPISVLFLEAPPASMAVNALATIDAAVENSPSNNGVTYSMSCGSANACGTFSASDEASATVYKAPAAIPSGTTVTITATAAADATKSVSATVTIVAPIPIAVAFPPATPASLEVNAAVTLNATITNDTSANPQVKWAVTCGGTACGSFNPTTTTNEAQTTYTAPAAIPPGNVVAVTATSVTDPTKSATAMITITKQGSTLANGTYVFQLSGPAGYDASFVTGVLLAQNGMITGGEQDIAEYTQDSDGGNYSVTQFSSITGGSYATTPDGNLQITYNSDYGTYTLNGVLASSSQGFVAQLYGSLGSGTLDLQTGTAAPSGGYAVSLYGGDEFNSSAWIGGVVNVDSAGGISGAGSVLDVDDPSLGSVYSGEQNLGAGTVSTPDQYGRVQIELNPAGSSTLPILYLTGYIVDSTHIRLVETGDNSGSNSFQGVLGGLALGQGTNTGQFSANSIIGSSYVLGASGEDAAGNLQLAGVITVNTGGTVTGTLNWNDLTAKGTQAPLAVTGSYTVDPTGRVTLTGLTDGSTFNYSMHLYLTGNGNGLLLSNDTADTFVGQAFQRQAGAFSGASLSGSYGFNGGQADLGAEFGAATVVGMVTAAVDSGVGALTGFADSGDGAADFALAGGFTPDASGVFTGTLSGLDAASRATVNSMTFYLVDNSRAVAIETDNSQLTLGFMQLQQ